MSTNSRHEITYDDVYTKGQAEINRITWKIQNFKTFLKDTKTQEFRTKIEENLTDNLLNRNVQLKMKFLGYENDVMELYYLSNKRVFLKSSLSVLINYSDDRSIMKNAFKTVDANKWIYLAKITKYQIDHDTSQFLNRYGHLSLIFTFMIATNIIVESTCVPKAKLNSDLEDLLNDGIFSDITIKSADGSEYQVHKAIIASRSVVLKAHFLHNTTECTTNIVESPFNADVLQGVITFIYSDRVPKIDENPEKLLAAADFYQLNQLKVLCEESLHRKLNFENAIEMLQLAELHSANHLKELTMKFIKNGQEKLITKSEGWLKINSAKLIKDIYECVITDDDRKGVEFVEITTNIEKAQNHTLCNSIQLF